MSASMHLHLNYAEPDAVEISVAPLPIGHVETYLLELGERDRYSATAYLDLEQLRLVAEVCLVELARQSGLSSERITPWVRWVLDVTGTVAPASAVRTALDAPGAPELSLEDLEV